MTKNTTLPTLFSFFLVTFFASSCKKNSTYPAGTVAIVGQNAGFPTLWTAGTPKALSSGFGDAYAIRYLNGHQFITGYQIADNGQNQCGYWEDGAFVQLYADPVQIAYVRDLAISGSDVYATGWIDSSYYTMAVYWKNGSRVNLAGGPESFYPNAAASGITIAENDLYICGYVNTNSTGHSVAVYWKDGNMVPVGDSVNTNSFANGIGVIGSNVYVAGSSYWENGVPGVLSGTPNYSWQANALTVSGPDVYVAGSIGLPYQTNTSAVYWKNEGQISLPGPSVASANAIFVSGADVYVAGTITNANAYTQAIYWKDGVPVTLPDSTATSIANGICVY